MDVDDVDLNRLVDSIRYITKKGNIDYKLKDRILSCMNAFDTIIHCDINLAYSLARDLNIIRALIKKESENLDRKFDIFERKLRKLATAILPKEDAEEIIARESGLQFVTIYNDNELRIIDTISKKSALNKLESARELLYYVQEIIRLMEDNTTIIQTALRMGTLSRMADLLNLFRIDASIALKLKKDILEVRAAVKKGLEGEPQLQNKLNIIKLKLEKAMNEYRKREGEYNRLLQQKTDQTNRAISLLKQSVKSDVGCGKSTSPAALLYRQTDADAGVTIKEVQNEDSEDVSDVRKSVAEERIMLKQKTTGPSVESIASFDRGSEKGPMLKGFWLAAYEPPPNLKVNITGPKNTIRAQSFEPYVIAEQTGKKKTLL